MTRDARALRSAPDLLAIFLLVMLWLMVSIPRLHGPIDLRWDASVYYVLGTSLAEGKGYRLLNEPGEIEAIQYPPLVPLLVAAHERALGTTDYLVVAPRLRWTYFWLSGLYLLAAYAVVRAFLPPALALFACAMTALSFYSFLYPSDTLYAEIPFGLVSMLFLLSARHGGRPASDAATGALGAAAYLLRTAGVALLAAWVAESLLRRRFRAAAFRAAIAAVPVLLWQGYVGHVTSSAAYEQPAYPYQRAPYAYSNVGYLENSWLVDPFRPELGRTHPSDLPRRVLHNLATLPRTLGESAWVPVNGPEVVADKLHRRFGIPVPPLGFGTALIALVGCGILGGGLLFALNRGMGSGSEKDRERPVGGKPRPEPAGRAMLVLYFALTVALIALTPWPDQFWRYLAPLTLISALFLAQGPLAVGRAISQGRVTRPLGQLAAALPLAFLFAVQLFVARSFLHTLLPVSYYDERGDELVERLLTYEPVWHALDPALEWLRRHAGPGDIVATTVPHLTYLRTGRRAVLPPMGEDPVTTRRLLDEVPVTYVLLDELGLPGISERYAAPAVEHSPGEWKLVYGDPNRGARVYERAR